MIGACFSSQHTASDFCSFLILFSLHRRSFRGRLKSKTTVKAEKLHTKEERENIQKSYALQADDSDKLEKNSASIMLQIVVSLSLVHSNCSHVLDTLVFDNILDELISSRATRVVVSWREEKKKVNKITRLGNYLII